jgi:pimeloyl-ACP methyl ester carboxylesterase
MKIILSHVIRARHMRYAASVCLAILLCPFALSETNLDGIWNGSFETAPSLKSQRIALSLGIRGENATVYAPVWGETDWPTKSVAIDGNRIVIRIAGANSKLGTFELVCNDRHDVLSGTYRWENDDYAVFLTKGSARLESDEASQIPKRSIAYSVVPVTLEHNGVTISGVLTLPTGNEAKAAVILVPGSTPELAQPEIPGRPDATARMWVISDVLTRAGFATLRTDSRGLGGSGGSFDQAALTDLAADVSAAVKLLRSRKDIPSNRIGVLGQSQGAAVAQILASDRDVDFAILLSGSGLEGQQMAVEGVKRLWRAIGRDRDPGFEPNARLVARVCELCAGGVPEVTIQRTLTDEFSGIKELRGLASAKHIRELTAYYGCPRWRSALAHNPSEVLRKCRVPILAMNGDQDVLLDAQSNLSAIREALNAAHNSDVTIEKLAGLDHSLRKAGQNQRRGEVIDPSALKIIQRWLDTHFSGRE